MKKKDVVISVRVDEKTKQKLEVESDMKNLTMNTLVGQIVSKHVDWDRFTEDIGFVFVTKSFMRAILTNVPDEIITEVAVTVCRGSMKDATIFMHGSFNLENFIKTLNLWLGASNIPFRNISDGKEKFIIQHELGEKYSHYLITVITSILNELKYSAINQEITDQSISFEIGKIKELK